MHGETKRGTFLQWNIVGHTKGQMLAYDSRQLYCAHIMLRKRRQTDLPHITRFHCYQMFRTGKSADRKISDFPRLGEERRGRDC